MRLRGLLVTFALGALAVALPLHAQSQIPAGPVHVQPGQLAPQKPAPPPKQQKPFRQQVNEVRLPVTVRDPHGQLAIDLGPEDFQVYDDGNLEHIEVFDFGGDPVSAVLVVENSSRVTPLLAGIRKTGILFTDLVMGANGRGSVIAFNDKPELVVPFTSNQERIQKSISGLKSGDSGAHLYDALARAVEMLQNQPGNRRRVVVAISESVDTGSLAKLGSVLRDAQLADVSIYTIGLSTTAAELRSSPSQYAGPQASPPGTFARPGVPGTPQTPSTMAQATGGNVNLLALVERLVKLGVNLVSPQALEAASAATGGEHIKTFHDKSIGAAMNRIGAELHAEYTLAYQAPQNGPWGYHSITVKVNRPGYHVRTRPGYFLAPPNGSTRSGS